MAVYKFQANQLSQEELNDWQEIRQACSYINESVDAGRLSAKRGYELVSSLLAPFVPEEFKGPGVSQLAGDEILRQQQHEALKEAQINARAEFAARVSSVIKAQEQALV